MRYIILATALTACATTQPDKPAKREGAPVKCATFSNGAANEVCVYPLGVLCFSGDKGMSCVQPLTSVGGVQ